MNNELEAIRARLEAATPGPWKADTGTRGDCVVWGPDGRFLMNAQAEPHWIEYPGEKRAVSFDVDRRDCEFIAHAPTDITRLLAALDAVAELHEPIESTDGRINGPVCAECSNPEDGMYFFHPCPTLDAITEAFGGDD